MLTTPGIDEATRVQCNDVIQLNSELLLKLINDVVDISCLDVANMKFSITTHEVVALCRNVVKMLDNIKQTSADIRFETEFDFIGDRDGPRAFAANAGESAGKCH